MPNGDATLLQPDHGPGHRSPTMQRGKSTRLAGMRVAAHRAMTTSPSVSTIGLFAALALGACAGSPPTPSPPASPASPASPTPEPSEVVGDTAPGTAPHHTPEAAAPPAAKEKTVQVVFQPKSGSALAGSGTLTETGEGVT